MWSASDSARVGHPGKRGGHMAPGDGYEDGMDTTLIATAACAVLGGCVPLLAGNLRPSVLRGRR